MSRTKKARTPALNREPHAAPPAILPSTDVVRGIQLQVPGSELVVRLSERIRWHRERGDALLLHMKKLSEVERDTEDDLMKLFDRYESPRATLQKKLRDHQERAAFLTFLRDHLDTTQQYRLDSMDLKMTEILPDRAW